MNDGNKEIGQCERCGAKVTDRLGGLCPRCLLELNLVPPTDGASGPAAASDAHNLPPSPSPSELAPHFPQLEILECLGRGGMGVVYRVRQRQLNRFAALKLLAPERVQQPQFAERFAREAQALARLSHPNIVGVYDFGESGGHFYLLMELVDGASLRELLGGGKLPSEEALAIVPKICEALQYAHNQGVVHRDIKPENVLLTQSGQVKIADFGIAKIMTGDAHLSGLTQDRQVIGTPHYMAPEQVEQPQRVDHRADIYSLGVVFYEMLTGELPLGKFAPPSNKATLDPRLDPVVLRALEKEPARRYQQAGQVKGDVETIATHPPPLRTVAAGAANANGRAVTGALFTLLFHLPFLAAFLVFAVYVTPRFGGMFQDLGVALPVLVVGTLLVSKVIMSYWWLLAPLALGADFLLAFLLERFLGRMVRRVYALAVALGVLAVIGAGALGLMMVLNALTQALQVEDREKMAVQELVRQRQLLAAEPQLPAATGDEDVLEVRSERLFAEGDANKLYYLIHGTNAAPPAKAYKLLLVLPGGDGGTNFLPFIKRIHQQSLPPGWVTAHLVAPQWDAAQAKKLVWPMRSNPYPGMRFATEEFAADVVADVTRRQGAEPKALYALAWSSAGPATYALALQDQPRLNGAFIAMSVFKPETLPDLSAAKGRAFYLLHSPQDFIPFAMARQAQSALQTNGATAHLESYPGGHGWRGDVFGTISNGVHWLEQNTGK